MATEWRISIIRLVDTVLLMVDRCFIAVDVEDPKVRSALLNAQKNLEATGADVKCVENENIHITLRFLGEIPEEMTARVATVVRTISFPSLVLSFEGVGVFPTSSRPSVVWAGIEGDVPALLNVFSELEKGLSSLGFDRERRPFQPHLTICRVKSGRNRSQLIDMVKSMEGEHFGQLRVDRIRLKKSVLTRAGPVYSTLAESRLS